MLVNTGKNIDKKQFSVDVLETKRIQRYKSKHDTSHTAWEVMNIVVKWSTNIYGISLGITAQSTKMIIKMRLTRTVFVTFDFLLFCAISESTN